MALDHAGHGDAMAQLFAQSPVARLALVRAAWTRAVGPDLARRTEIVGIENGTLRVRVPDARWRTVLHRMQGDIIGRLMRIAGDLAPKRLGFLEGAVATPPVAPAVPRPTPEDADPGTAMREAAAAIPDPELRERFLRTAGRYLARARRI